MAPSGKNISDADANMLSAGKLMIASGETTIKFGDEGLFD